MRGRLVAALLGRRGVVGVVLLFFIYLPFVTYEYQLLSYDSKVSQKLDFKSNSYFIVALLKNNEKIIENWSKELLNTIKALGDCPIYVSILENGDSIDNTALHLLRLQKKLDDMKINNTVNTNHVLHRTYHERIEWLALLRNKAMEPLKNLPWSPNETLIVYLNDVWFKTKDILHLIGTNNGEYDIACALDMIRPGFYDKWVSRDIVGDMFAHQFPYSYEQTTQSLIRKGMPVRVFSCWNGISVLRAEPFLLKNVTFRSSYPHQVYHSECFWICYDFWDVGYTRVVVNPNVVVAYSLHWYWFYNYISPWLLHPWHRLYMQYYSRRRVVGAVPSVVRDVPLSATGWRSYK